MKKGKLIVIDGADGSGKATQTKLLVSRLKREGYRVRTLDFPQYEKNFFGSFIGACLAGRHGDFLKVDPYIASALYAADRFESKKTLDTWLRDGCIVVLDRYVSANQIHQGAKIFETKKRAAFLRWLDKLEYEVYGLPRPNLVLYLDVPQQISDVLLSQKKEGISQNKILKGKKDLAEQSAQHLADARASAISIVRKGNVFQRIVCAAHNQILSRESIADMVWKKVTTIL